MLVGPYRPQCCVGAARKGTEIGRYGAKERSAAGHYVVILEKMRQVGQFAAREKK
jgi:hypothetical protein